MTELQYKFQNCFCNPFAFLPSAQRENVVLWNKDELDILYEYVIAKNCQSGVKELWILNDFMIDLNKFAAKYNIKIKNIVRTEKIFSLPISLLTENDLLVFIEKIEDMNEDFLSNVVNLSSKLDLPLLINFGQNLQMLGIIENNYGKSPERVLEDFGLLDRKCFLLGCNYLDKDALSLFDNYNVEYIFTPITDAENGLGFINFKLYENRICHIASGNEIQIDLQSQANFLRLCTNNLLALKNAVSAEKYLNLLPFEIKNTNNQDAVSFLKFNVSCYVENFEKAEQNYYKLLARKCQIF